MARIAGVNLPANKKIEIALNAIYGIGFFQVQKILQQTQINPKLKTSELSEEQVNRLKQVIEKQYKVEGDLKREVLLNIKRLKDIGSYRGLRHSKGLPVRGQRTKTNNRTVRNNVRRTMGSGRKLSAQKT